jgi:hypothetical protein
MIPEDQDKNLGVVKNGKLVDNDKKDNSEEKLVISNSTPVKDKEFSLSPRDNANIVIYFKEQSAWLKFVRDTKDRFVLHSVTKNNKKYTFAEEVKEPPFLCIYDERSRNDRTPVTRARTVSAQDGGSSSFGTRLPIPEYIMLKSGESPYLTLSAVVEFLSEKGKSRGFARRYIDIEAIVEHYINEAKKENINHDIAIAQMCYATQYLTNKTLFNNMNYAGLTKEGGRWNGKSWNGVFPRSLIGVRAHIQHLKGYASTARLVENNVDPRFHLLANRRGKGDTLHRLCGYWVARNSGKYENELRKILEELYKHQDRHNQTYLARR